MIHISNWQKVKLGDLVKFEYGKGLPESKRLDGNIPVYGSNGIVGYHNESLVKGRGIIVGRKGTIGQVEWAEGDFWTIDTTYYIPEGNKYDLLWLYYLLKSLNLKNLNRATGVPGLNREDVYKLSILLPERRIQQKIAGILSSVDKAIQKTDEIIQKTELLKQGLMQKLLTKGIGHTKFSRTKYGEIPEDWKLNPLGDSGIKIIDGDRGINYPKKIDFAPIGYCLFLNNKNIFDDSFLFNETSFISKEKDQALRKGKLQRQDVILTTRGTVGNVAYYDKSIPYENIRINSGMVILRGGNHFSPSFVYFLFRSPQIKSRMMEISSGSAQPQLPIKSLNYLLIPQPPIDEQNQIVNVLSAVEVKLTSCRKYRLSLLSLKNGFMQDIFNQKVKI